MSPYADAPMWRPPEPPARRALKIIDGIASDAGLTRGHILGPRRGKQIVRARYMAIRAVAKACPEFSLPDLGRVFNRDHTSIGYALGRLARKQPSKRLHLEAGSLVDDLIAERDRDSEQRP